MVWISVAISGRCRAKAICASKKPILSPQSNRWTSQRMPQGVAGATINMSGMDDHVGQRQVASNDREIGEQIVARTWDSLQVRRLRPGGNLRRRFPGCRIIGLTAQHLGDGDPLGAGGIGDDQLVREEDGKGFAADEDAGAPVCVAVTRWHLLADCNDVVGVNVGLPQLCEGGFRAAIG
jgi:hypothetical protein